MSTLLAIPPTPSPAAGLHALQALLRERSPLPALRVFLEELGNVFQITLPGFKPVVLVGPEANHFLLVEAREEVRWRPEGDPVARLLRQGVLVVDGPFHDDLRRQINPALHKRMLGNYAEIMLRRSDQVLAGWADGSVRDMLVDMRRIALLILMESLFGEDFTEEMPGLWKPILRTLEYISPGAWILWSGIPRPGYRSALRKMDHYLYQVIRSRRENPGAKNDLIALLMSNPALSDDLIRDQILTLLIAGHDTSTALLAWALYLLGRHPGELARAQEEVDRVLGNDPPDQEGVGRLVFLEQVIKETLRLYPPIHIGMRIAAQDLEFGGCKIPAGTRVVYSIYLTHRMKEYWPEPDRFDPERFAPEQSQVRPPYTYVPFGGGPRNCIGMAFAQVEVKIVLARVLQKYNLAWTGKAAHAHMGATLEPRPGVYLRLSHR
jgi:cytochrome P450